VARKRQHIRVLEKLGFVRKKLGKKEITYVLVVGERFELTTDVPKGRGDIPPGTMTKILNWEIHLSQQEYKDAQAGKINPVEYLALLRSKGILQ
jgi:hypothetical protein